MDNAQKPSNLEPLCLILSVHSAYVEASENFQNDCLRNLCELIIKICCSVGNVFRFSLVDVPRS
jgi:hypothetical protein